MKILITSATYCLALLLSISSCKDQDAEKKAQELEKLKKEMLAAREAEQKIKNEEKKKLEEAESKRHESADEAAKRKILDKLRKLVNEADNLFEKGIARSQSSFAYPDWEGILKAHNDVLMEIKELQKNEQLKGTYYIQVLTYLEGSLIQIIEKLKDVAWKKKWKKYSPLMVIPILTIPVALYFGLAHKAAIRDHFKRGTKYETGVGPNGELIYRAVGELHPPSLGPNDSSTLVPSRAFAAEQGGALNQEELIKMREETRNKVTGGDLTWALDNYIATERALDVIAKRGQQPVSQPFTPVEIQSTQPIVPAQA